MITQYLAFAVLYALRYTNLYHLTDSATAFRLTLTFMLMIQHHFIFKVAHTALFQLHYISPFHHPYICLYGVYTCVFIANLDRHNKALLLLGGGGVVIFFDNKTNIPIDDRSIFSAVGKIHQLRKECIYGYVNWRYHG